MCMTSWKKIHNFGILYGLAKPQTINLLFTYLKKRPVDLYAAEVFFA